MNTRKVKKKNTVRISQKDLLKLLAENEHMKNQVTELQTRGTELITENRDLKKKIEELELNNNILKSQINIQEPYFCPSPDLFDPNIYYDSNKNYQ